MGTQRFQEHFAYISTRCKILDGGPRPELMATRRKGTGTWTLRTGKKAMALKQKWWDFVSKHGGTKHDDSNSQAWSDSVFSCATTFRFGATWYDIFWISLNYATMFTWNTCFIMFHHVSCFYSKLHWSYIALAALGMKCSSHRYVGTKMTAELTNIASCSDYPEVDRMWIVQKIFTKPWDFEHVGNVHILSAAGWLWNPMISVILKLKLVWVCWSNPRKNQIPVRHSKTRSCSFESCVVKFFFTFFLCFVPREFKFCLTVSSLWKSQQF